MGFFSISNMNTASTNADTSVQLIERSILNRFFDRMPADASIESVCATLRAPIRHDPATLSKRDTFCLLRDHELADLVAACYLHEAATQHLPALVDMAQEHVDDIDAGLADGTYAKAENADLPQKREVVELFRRAHASQKCTAPAMPSLVLVVFSKGGSLNTFKQVGTLPGVMIQELDERMVGCGAGPHFQFDPCWADLLNEVYEGDIPDYVKIGPGPT